MSNVKKFIDRFGLPRVIIIAFLIFLCISAIMLDIPITDLISDALVRTGMNGVLVLAMVPGILAGIGLNFGIPIGIVCGLLGGLIAIEMDLVGFTAFFAAVFISIPLSIVAGVLYGLLLNRVKGSEMTIATYAGFSIVSLMSIAWLILPFKSEEMRWPIGTGLRTTITLQGRYERILNNWASFDIFGITIPTGLLLFFGACCFLMWLFLRSQTGISMKAVGDNPRFALASGIHENKMRIVGTVLSTMLGAVGIVVYGQSFGFIQLYQAPMFMGFAATAAVLIGGASIKKANISNVIIGTFLFQSLLVVSLPVANKVMSLGSLAEITRIIVSNGIILYALTQIGGGE
ncbi:monosaccharide ABC transporter membrane protein, CUT2 family [Tindallia magadiensis]|uniref:Monosaccharide ABC transporter membrane protein, CUT2 family n=1 Tax=Tindallia magadiensis TaxID=69895 RepID=A0A1I3EKQ0_9FIRM|nr:ABC transporter [Tindallia magadiensis]SFH99390.1 monosaccharide ABC transporter membrane protein, CUT2 family [Tindallia magadiensis]